MSSSMKLITVSLSVALVLVGLQASARGTTADLQAAARANPSLMHQWSFEGPSVEIDPIESPGVMGLQASFGDIHLVNITDGGIHGGEEPDTHIEFEFPGWDGTSTAASTWHSGGGFNTADGHGDYFHTSQPIAPPTAFTWEVVLQTGFVPIDGTEAPVEYNLGYVIAHRVAGGSRGYFLWQGTSHEPSGDSFTSLTGGWQTGEVTVVDAPLAEDNWYYMAGTYLVNTQDGTSQVDVYAADLTAGDTTLTHTSFTNSSAYDYDVEGTFGIGGRFDRSKESFPGALDEVNFYDSVLDAQTLQSHLADLVAGGGGGPHPGDVNDDKLVNETDLAFLEAQFGGTPGATFGVDSADFDQDGDVDLGDFRTMRANWLWDGTGNAPLASTPEPATMTVLAIGALAVLRRKRK